MFSRTGFQAFALVISAVALCSQTAANDPAIVRLLARLQLEPRNTQLCEQIGLAYTRLEDFDQAAVFYRKALQIDPRRISAEKNLGTVLWFAGHKAESIGIFAALEKKTPQDPVPPFYLGLAAFEQKDFPKAAALLERAGPLASANPEVAPVLIETDLATGRFDRAKRLAEARIASGAMSSAEEVSRNYRWLGEACDGLKLPDQAYRAFEQAIENGLDIEDNYLALGAFATAHANSEFARKTLTRGLERLPDSAKLTMQLGLSWAMDGDFERARGFFDSASRKDPNWSLPLLALGITDLQAGNSAAAREVFAKALERSPDDYRCYYLHATAIGRSSPDVAQRKEMISDLRRAIELNPRQARVRAAMAQAEAASDVRAAEIELREALRIDPAEPSALYQLALLKRREGNTAEAARLLAAFQTAKGKARGDDNELVLILKTPK